MISISAGLFAAFVLAIWWSNTRWIAVSCIAALCFFFPWLVLVVVPVVAWAFWFFRIRIS